MDLVLVDTRSGRRRTIALDVSPILLGSGVDCDVVVPSAEVAEHACHASRTPDGIVLEALDDGGFTLNEKRARAAILHPGDVVKLGPFQLVAAGAREEPAAPAPAPAEQDPFEGDEEPRERSAEEIAAKAVREAQFAARRRARQRKEAVIAVVLIAAVGIGAFVLWERGTFSGGASSRDDARDTASRAGDSAGGGPAPISAESEHTPIEPAEVTATEDEENGSAEPASWRKPSSPEEVAETLAKVDKLLEHEEFARCRWLLWQLSPTTDEDRARVETRRREVDAAAKKGGDDHLAFVEELVKRGKLPAALGHCEEESIERFRGLAVWYRLLEKADEIEMLLNERVPETLRAKVTRKHARKMPPDLESRPPPPARTSLSEEMGAMDAPVARPRPRETVGAPAASAPEREDAPAPAAPTPEELAFQTVAAARLAELAAAKPAAFETAAKKAAEAVRKAGAPALELLAKRALEIATALEQAPECEALAALRRRVQALADARAAALEFLFDEQRYGVEEESQKKADRLVGAVRDLWGSEQGGAPAPLVTLSDEYARLVDEARLLDELVTELGGRLPDRPELLATRLVPRWASKLSIRNCALNVDERRRIDADRESGLRNQQLRDVKDADALQLLNYTNAYREMLGRPQLAFDRKLYEAAREYADLMGKQLKSAKESDPQPEPTPRVSGKKPAGGANYLRGRFSARQALQAWCKVAAAHRNLLDPAHRSMAAANASSFWAQLFGLSPS